MNAKKFICALLFVSIFLAGQAPVPARASVIIRYVKPSPTGAGTCSSWANACSLQGALGLALSGNQLWVKFGTYTPGSLRTDTFTLKNGVKVYGGFAGTETLLTQRNPATHVTVLSGEIGAIGDSSDNVYNVVTASWIDSAARLDGFTVTAGNANPGYGGGIYIESGNPTLTNVTFSSNSASISGGGMYNSLGSPTLTNVTFSGNSAVYGGGMLNFGGSPTLANVTFSDNSATYGGGMYNQSGNATLTNVTFSSDSASALGGGLVNYQGSPTLINLTFSGNSAGQGGGGMYDDGGSPTLTNVTFSGNSAINYGGGMYNSSSNPVLTNVTFNSNASNGSGGGMANSGSNPTLTNVIFNANSAGAGGGMHNAASSPSLTDVTFSGNQGYDAGAIFNDSSSPALTDVTFNGNSAIHIGGGIYNNNGSSPTLTNVTMSGNSDSGIGGGMYNAGGSAHIYDSIFWGDGTEIYDVISYPTLVDSIVAPGCPTLATCTNVLTTDPVLGALADNGGFTQTMSIGVGSAAIDTGGQNSTCAATDQRGVTRPQGANCDMGAYEKLYFAPADGAAILTLRPTFDWENVTGAANYNIQVSKLGNFSTLLLNVVVVPSTYTPGVNLPPTTKLYWRLRSKVETTYGSWSSVMSFTTPNPPSTPVLKSPANNVLITNYLVSVDWANSTLPLGTNFDHYEVQVDDNSNFGSPFADATTAAGDISDSSMLGSLQDNTRFYWRVRAFNNAGEYSAWSAARYFRTALLPPTLNNPANSAVLLNKRPAFDWNAVSGASSYNIQVSKNPAFSLLVLNTNSVSVIFTPAVDLPASSVLYWRVRSNGTNGPSAWSAVRSFTTGNPPSVPALSSPANGSLTTDYTPLLDWANSALPVGTTFHFYQVQVDDNSDFGSPVVTAFTPDGNITASNFTPASNLADNTTYYWHMRAFNSVGEYSGWSARWTFRTAMLAPTLNSPADLSAPGVLRPVFDWNDVSGATNYTMQIAKNSTFSLLVMTVTVTPSTFTPGVNLPAHMTLYWRVKANGANPSTWSGGWSFTTP